MDNLEDRLTKGILDRCDKTQDMVGKQISLPYRTITSSDIRQIHDRARDLIANYKECCKKSCKKEKATCKKSLQVSRSDIERMVKRKVFNTRNADTLKKMFIIAEINNSFKVYCGALCIGESLTIEEAKGIVEVFLIDFICSVLGVEEER